MILSSVYVLSWESPQVAHQSLSSSCRLSLVCATTENPTATALFCVSYQRDTVRRVSLLMSAAQTYTEKKPSENIQILLVFLFPSTENLSEHHSHIEYKNCQHG